MPVTWNIEKVETFEKHENCVLPGVMPNRLNENSRLYGKLREEIDLKMGGMRLKRDETTNQLENFLKFLKKTHKKGSNLREAIDADFVADSRILRRIATSSYQNSSTEFQAIRHRDVIFLCEKHDENQNYADSTSDQFKNRMILDEKGFPFNPFKTEKTSVSNKKGVLKSILSDGNEEIKAIYTTNLDAIDENGNHVELKTSALTHKKWIQTQSHRHFVQAVLGDVAYIVYGRKVSRSEQKIDRVEKVWTSDIPKDPLVTWNPETCFETLFSVLQKIRDELQFDEEAILVKVAEKGVELKPELADLCSFMDLDFLRHFQ